MRELIDADRGSVRVADLDALASPGAGERGRRRPRPRRRRGRPMQPHRRSPACAPASTRFPRRAEGTCGLQERRGADVGDRAVTAAIVASPSRTTKTRAPEVDLDVRDYLALGAGRREEMPRGAGERVGALGASPAAAAAPSSPSTTAASICDEISSASASASDPRRHGPQRYSWIVRGVVAKFYADRGTHSPR